MSTHRTYPKTPGFRLGIYVFKDAEIVDYAAPYGVFSVARRFDPELDAFLIADAMRPVQTQSGFTVCRITVSSIGPTWTPSSSRRLRHAPGDAQRPPARLHSRIAGKTLITSVCTGSWICGEMGLLDGKPATNRKEPDRLEASNFGKVPIGRTCTPAAASTTSRAPGLRSVTGAPLP
jgi:transcriptional regulator GlxA family with amidase domain